MSTRDSQNKPMEKRTRSAAQLDHLIESEQHLAMLGSLEPWLDPFSLSRLESWLVEEGGLPRDAVRQVIQEVRVKEDHLGLERPAPVLILAWVSALLEKRGFDTHFLETRAFEIPLKSVEHNIYHPGGSHTGSEQNPEATSLAIATTIKEQYARRRVFMKDVVEAHDQGLIDITEMGSVDRPHDIFITLDYLKKSGLPATNWAPQSGPARHANVLLAQMVRFTRELQNHFSGDIHWGFVNTLMLPFLSPMNDRTLEQFLQQLLFEFAQLDSGRSGRSRGVILDMDMEVPQNLADLPALLPGATASIQTYGSMESVLHRFNEILLDILQQGDYKGVPFHAPQIVFHLNRRRLSWTARHQSLFQVAFQHGNPAVAFSHADRDFGPLGRWPVNHPDLLHQLRDPAQLRGFSTSSVAINLTRLALDHPAGPVRDRLDRALQIVLAAQRQKRLFVSRLMAFGRRGPLRFLRHKFHGEPFLTMDSASQIIQIIGLAEATALWIGAPRPDPLPWVDTARQVMQTLRELLEIHGKQTRIRCLLAGAKEDRASYRLANQDFMRFGATHAPFLLKQREQSEPFYASGSHLLAYSPMSWRDRIETESPLHPLFDTGADLIFSLGTSRIDDPLLFQGVARKAFESGCRLLRFCPDFRYCLDCFMVFQEAHHAPVCPQCGGTSIESYGYAPAGFAPASCWNRGRRAEFALRHRMNHLSQADQPGLPLD